MENVPKLQRIGDCILRGMIKHLKIEVLSSSTLDSHYLDCVKFFIEFWLNVGKSSGLHFYPKVLLISNRIPPDLEKYSKYIILFNDSRISNSFTSQVLRILYPSLSNADLVMTSDIDMLPIKNKNIAKVLAGIYANSSKSELLNDFVIFRDVLPPGQIPICYNVGSPSTWQILNNCISESDVKNFLFNEYNKVRGFHFSGSSSSTWYRDQEILFQLIEGSREFINFISLNDLITGYRRLDRLSLKAPLHWFHLPRIIFGNFDSYHLHHPVSSHLFWYRTILFIRRIAKSFDV